MPVPTKIDSNATNLAFAEEQTLKVLPGSPTWYGLEPNSYKDMGAAYSTVARTPIVAHRQQAKGTITDLDAKAGFNVDLTQTNLMRLLQGFFFADAFEKPATNPLNGAQVVITSVDVVAGNHYNAAAGLNVFKVGHLVFAKGFGLAANNGLKNVSAIAAGILSVTQVLATEAAPPAGASVEAVGFQFAAGDLVLTIVGSTIVIASAAVDLTTLGLNVGEWIYVGGDTAGTKYVNNAPFFARIKSIVAGSIVLDMTMAAVIADAGVGKTIQIFFGKVIVNANSSNVALIKRRSYTLERQLGNDGTGIQAEYLLGAIPNDLTLNLAQAAKATVDIDFVGMDIQNNTGAVGIIAGTRVASPFEDAINTSHDLVALRIAVLDPATFNPTALFGFATDLKLMVKNGVVPNKGLAVLGAFEATAGDFTVEGTATAYFSTVAAAAAVRANSDVGITAIVAKKNAGMVIDVPLVMLGGGLNKVEKDKSVHTDLTQTAAKNPAGYTALWNFFNYLPNVAIPA